MSSRQSTPPVTLFPFLAVLVCAMGALILLLLVTTRMIRKQAVAERAAQQRAAGLAAEEQLPAVQELLLPPPLEPIHVEMPVLVPAPDFAQVEPVDPAPVIVPSPPPVPDAVVRELEYQARLAEHAELERLLKDDWQHRVCELREQRTMLADQLVQRTKDTDQLRTEETRAREQLASYEAALKLATVQEQGLNSHIEELTRSTEFLGNQIRSLNSELQQLEQALPPPPKFQIVPFDVLTGTTRRPIIIECTADRVAFASEQVEIHADQLSGFTPQYNPLLAGARALTAYWSRQDGPDSPPPYVLIVVRAQGTIGYYVARKMLDELDDAFGYELVEDDRAIKWPEADPAATAACRHAVERVLADQSQMKQRLASGRSGLPDDSQFAGRDGHFWLPEVDQLREPNESFVFGNHVWSKPSLRSPTSRPAGPGINRTEISQDRSASVPAGSAPGGTQSLDRAPPLANPVPAQPPGTSPRGPIDAAFLEELQQAAERSRQPTPKVQPKFSPAGNSQRDGATAAEPPPLLLPHLRSGTTGSGSGRPGTIGLERQIRIEIRSEAMIIDEQLGLDITPGMTTQQLQQLMAQGLDLQIRSWGVPPGAFYWKPYVKVILHPGGHVHLTRLQSLLKDWSIDCEIEHKLN